MLHPQLHQPALHMVRLGAAGPVLSRHQAVHALDAVLPVLVVTDCI